MEFKEITIHAEKIIGQFLSALLLNSFYSAQILHHLQGNELDDEAREKIWNTVMGQWENVSVLYEETGKSQTD